MQKFFLVLATALAMVPLLTRPAAAQSHSPDVAAGRAEAPKAETTLLATGTARVFRTPDYVDIVVGIETLDKTASGAHNAAKSVMEKVVAAIKQLKLAGEDLQTGTVELNPRYDDRPQYPSGGGPDVRVIVGYAAANTLRVRTSDVTTVARVIDAALEAGANRVDRVEFGIKEAIEAREEAITLATKAARRKAQVMAQALELKLGRVITASANTNQSGWWGANRISQMSNFGRGESGGGGGEGESVVPGRIEIWADATVTFAGKGMQ